MKNSMLLRRLLLVLLVIGIIIEIGFQTFWKNALGTYVSPIIWMLGGVLVSISSFGLIGVKSSYFNESIEVKHSKQPQTYLIITYSVLFILGVYWCVGFLVETFEHFPIDPKLSDIIPSIQMYVERLLEGEVVYRPLPFEGYSVDPTYLPLLWSPYIFSEVLNIDYRWTAFIVFLLSILVLQLRLLKQGIGLLELLIKIAIPFVWVYLFTQFDRGTLGMAVELLPVGFYLLLTSSVLNKNPLTVAVGILICLLSRYAFTFWLPIYLLIYWVESGFKNVFRVSLYVLFGVLGLYILPFLSKDWSALSKGLAYYERTAKGQWETQYWQEPSDKPFHLTQGLSVAIYFFDLDNYSVEERLSLNRKIHISVCGLVAIFMLIGYFYFRKKGLNVRVYLLVSLKLYLVVFYGFFYVPFSYLYQLPLFLTIPLLYRIPFKKIEGPSSVGLFPKFNFRKN